MNNLKMNLFDVMNRKRRYADPPEKFLRYWQDFLYNRCNEWGYQMREDTQFGIRKTVDCFAARRVHEISVAAQKHSEQECPIYRSPKGVLLCGGVGTGKTTLLQILSKPSEPEYLENSCVIRYKGAAYISVTDILGALLKGGREFAESFCKRYRRDLLVIDDLGQEGDMTFYGTKISKFIELIIERRYQHFETTGAVTVIATNLQPANLEQTYDERTVSRLAAMTEIIPFNGTDWRKTGGTI